MFRLINSLKNKKGFTLIELIVVLAVLAIIMAIAVPRFLGIQEDARESADESTGAMLAKAAELYLASDTSHAVGDLNSISVTALETKLKTTAIDLKSKKYDGETISFSTTSGGSVEVKFGTVTVYPK